MPAETSPTVPLEIRIPVPRQYRDYLIYKQNMRYAVVITLYIGVLLFFHFVAHWRFTSFTVVGLLILSVLGWLHEIRKPWFYVIDAKHMTVIWWEIDVVWQRDAIVGVEESEWRGLPMLRLRHDAKNPKREAYWVIVYSPEDAEMVRTQVIPLIEKYRHQYRQPNMADRLRS